MDGRGFDGERGRDFDLDRDRDFRRNRSFDRDRDFRRNRDFDGRGFDRDFERGFGDGCFDDRRRMY